MKSICVFAGSNAGARVEYVAAARELGRVLAQRRLGLVYGGARVGLMGVLADEALSEGAHVIGVMPEALVAKEVAHRGLSELRVVKSMTSCPTTCRLVSIHRVQMKARHSGIELESALAYTWTFRDGKVVHIHGYFDRLLSFAEHCVDEGFVKPEHRSMISVSASASELLDGLAAYKAPVVAKWIESAQT